MSVRQSTGSSLTSGPPKLEGLRYSFVWEDHALLEDGLGIEPDDDILSVTSGGQNVLNLALMGPRSVTAVDLNPVQSALLELQLAAVQTLSHADFIRLLGAADAPNRIAIYQQVRPMLSVAA